MPGLDNGSLTRIGFRRDVKLFLAALVGYLIVVILALLLTMQSSVFTFTRATEQAWERQTEWLGRAVDELGTKSPQALQSLLDAQHGMIGAIGVELRLVDGRVITSGQNLTGLGRVLERSLTIGTLRVLFDDTIVTYETKRLRTIAVVSFVSAIGTALLLMLYIPRILRPVEEMLTHAAEIEERSGADEAQFVVATFRKTITTLKEQKAELERLHNREKTRADDLERISSTLKRSIVSGLIATDPTGRLVDVNDPARRILGIEEPDVEGRLLASVLAPGEFTDSLLETLRTRASIARKEATYEASHGVVPLGVTTVPLFADDDSFLGVLAVFTDLAEVRMLEQRVREMQTLADLGEIAAGIAHEFRNSLSTINGNLRLIQKMSTSDELSGRIDAAKGEADLLARAVDSLMAFAKPIEPEYTRVNLTGLLATLKERFSAEAPEVEISLSGEDAEVIGDPTLLRVAFENVMRNALDAVRAADRAGTVAIEVGLGDEVTVRVRDNGIGLDAKDAARFMLPFQSGKSSGFGLGLAMTRRIAVSLGGRLELTGVPGEGATVTLLLPRA